MRRKGELYAVSIEYHTEKTGLFSPGWAHIRVQTTKKEQACTLAAVSCRYLNASQAE